MGVNAFTRPHEMVYSDMNGEQFVLRPGTKIYEEIKLQHYNDEEADEALILSEIMSLTFKGMTIEQIEKEYCGDGGSAQRLLKLPQDIPLIFGGKRPDDLKKSTEDV